MTPRVLVPSSRRPVAISERDRSFSGDASELITSTRNQHAVLTRKLANKKHREREGLTLIEGVRVMETALDGGVDFAFILAGESFLRDSHTSTLAARAEEGGALILPTSAEVLDSVSTVATAQDFVAVVRIPEWTYGDVLDAAKRHEESGNSLIVIADRISDPGNFGVLARTARALGAAGYMSTPGTVDAFSPRVIRASAGMVFTIPGAQNISENVMMEELRLRGYAVIASSPDAEREIWEYSPDSRLALLVGEEAAGVSPELMEVADEVLRIPMVPGAESLNVGSAAAIFLYEFSPLRRR